MKSKIFILLLLTLTGIRAEAGEVGVQFVCAGAKANGKDVLAGVEKFYAGMSGLSAKFVQESTFAGLEISQTSHGSVRFQRPGNMDWEYSEPDKQTFIADGKTLWFYQPDLKQVTISDFRQAFRSDLPVSFLLGLGTLSGSFNLKKVCSVPKGLLLDLAPKNPDAQGLRGFSLIVDAKDYSPRGSRVTDIGGNETMILFSEAQLAPSFPDKTFEFSIPRGADIIDQRQATK